MSQSVELSDELVLAARRTSQASGRSISEQIEFWVRLGRALESLVKSLTPDDQAELFAALSECGIRQSVELLGQDGSRYESDAFTRELTRIFHRAKRRALGSKE